jgi:hypothetical protein
MINVPLLQKALDHIEAHPEEWEQELWGKRQPCGTTACLAGHITLIDGWTPVLHGLSFGEWLDVERDGRKETVPVAATLSLGISSPRVNDRETGEYLGHLWDSFNDRQLLWELANHLAGGQLTLPADLQE